MKALFAILFAVAMGFNARYAWRVDRYELCAFDVALVLLYVAAYLVDWSAI